MANLSSSSRLGNTSTSSLIKSSRSIASAITANQDEFYRIQYQNSAKTATDLQTYQQYLTGRIGNLTSTGSVTDNTKAMTLSQTIVTATASNVSADITRENIAIFNGTATPQDKLNLITQEFTRAGSVGDTSLQQSLVSQASSLSQTINYQAKAAVTAANTLKAAGATQQNDVAATIDNNLKNLNAYVGATGMSNLNNQMKTFLNTKNSQGVSMKDSYTQIANSIDTTQPGGQQKKDMILNAINSSQPSYADLVAGSGAAMIQAHYLAYVAQLPVDAANGTNTAQSYLQSSQNLADGSATVPTLHGGMTIQEAQQYQANPAMFVPKESMVNGVLTATLEKAATNGVKFDANGNVISNSTGKIAGTALSSSDTANAISTLKSLGFSFDQSNSAQANYDQGITVQANQVNQAGNKLTPSWLKPILGGQLNPALTAYVTPQGIQIASQGADGKSNIYLIASDKNGNHAVYNSTGVDQNGLPIFGKQAANGDYGFNQNQNSVITPAAGTVDSKGNSLTKGQINQNANYANNGSFGFGDAVNNIENWFGFGHANAVSSTVNNANQAVNQMQVQMQQTQGTPIAQLKMPDLNSMPLPTVPTVTPVAAPTIQNAQSPAPQTANPQANNASPQPVTANPQAAGNLNLNQSGGGTGISLGQSSGWSMQL